jgi:hypothetical protein
MKSWNAFSSTPPFLNGVTRAVIEPLIIMRFHKVYHGARDLDDLYVILAAYLRSFLALCKTRITVLLWN